MNSDPRLKDVIVVRPPSIARWPELPIYGSVLEQGGRPFDRISPASLFQDYTPKAVADRMVTFVQRLVELDLAGKEDTSSMLFIEGLSSLPAHTRIVSSLHGWKPLRLVGLIHGGSFIPGDKRLAMHPWAEATAFGALDRTIVPSEWHAELQKKAYPDTEVTVARWPLPPNLINVLTDIRRREYVPERKRRLVFPHRELPEKGVDLFRELGLTRAPGWTYEYTKRNPDLVDQNRYYNYLLHSKAVFANATMETYGVAIEEAMVLGCCPVLNRHPVYEELYSRNNVHWHDGSVFGVSKVLKEVEDCPGNHLKTDKGENNARAIRLLGLSLHPTERK